MSDKKNTSLPAALHSVTCLGIIAGHGELPCDILRACKSHGIDPYILAYEGQTDPDFVQGLSHEWVGLGQVGKALKALRAHHVSHLVMAGYFDRPAWSTVKPDLKGMALMAKLVGKPMGDDGLFRVIIDFFEGEGFTVLSPDDLLGTDAMIPLGPLTTVIPDAQALSDIKRGFHVAKALGTQDVGQSVVVQQGLVLGVEALEGSDCLIARTADLKQEGLGGVFIKVIKPGQDTRVDRSVIGPETIRQVSKSGLRGIAAEAKNVILLQKDETIALANDLGLFIIGVSSDDQR